MASADEKARRKRNAEYRHSGKAGLTIVAVDTEGKVLVFNPAAEQLLGYTAAEIIGTHTPGMEITRQHTPAIWHDEDEVVNRAAEMSEELGWLVKPGFDVFTLIHGGVARKRANGLTYARMVPGSLCR